MLIKRFKFLNKLKELKKSDSKKTKEVTCYKYKKSGYIKNECPKFKYKNKGVNEKKKAFKATYNDSSEFEKEEEQ